MASTLKPTLGEWLGSHRAPAKLAGERITVLRSADGPGLACAPGLRVADDDVQAGETAEALLAVLDAFGRPATIDAVVGRLRKKYPEARDVIDGLAAGGFLVRS